MNKRIVREKLLQAYGQASSFVLLDTTSNNTDELRAEIYAARQTGVMIRSSIKEAIDELWKQD